MKTVSCSFGRTLTRVSHRDEPRVSYRRTAVFGPRNLLLNLRRDEAVLLATDDANADDLALAIHEARFAGGTSDPNRREGAGAADGREGSQTVSPRPNEISVVTQTENGAVVADMVGGAGLSKGQPANANHLARIEIPVGSGK